MKGQPGAWNVLNKRFFSVSAPLRAWAVVVFESENRAKRNRVATFARELSGNLIKLGMYHVAYSPGELLQGQLMVVADYL